MAKKTTSVKTAKKSAPKTSSKPRTAVASHAVAKPTKAEPAKASLKKTLKTRKSYIILVLFMLALGALLYYGRGIFVAAVVNGQPISRLSVVQEAEKISGKEAMDTIIRNILIEQEARKAKISISQKEIDDEMKKLEEMLAKQGQKLDEVLVQEGLSRAEIERRIRLQKIVDKLVGSDVKVTDEEVNQYIETNRDFLPQDQTEEEWKKYAAEQVKNQKLTEKVQTWLESINNKAKVLYFVQY